MTGEKIGFGPTEPERGEFLDRTAQWLEEHGRVDASETGGNVATRVLVHTESGQWEFPLLVGIDLVDQVDAASIENSPPTTIVRRRPKIPKLEPSITDREYIPGDMDEATGIPSKGEHVLRDGWDELDQPEIVVLHTGTDDVAREAEVDLKGAVFTPKESLGQ